MQRVASGQAMVPKGPAAKMFDPQRSSPVWLCSQVTHALSGVSAALLTHLQNAYGIGSIRATASPDTRSWRCSLAPEPPCNGRMPVL